MGQPSAVAPSLRPLVLSLYGGACHYKREGCTRVATTVDHIVPFAISRCNAWWNLAPSCANCNQLKSNQTGFCVCWRCAYATAYWRWLKQQQPFWNPASRSPAKQRQRVRRKATRKAEKTWRYRASPVTLDDILAANAERRAKLRSESASRHPEWARYIGVDAMGSRQV